MWGSSERHPRRDGRRQHVYAGRVATGGIYDFESHSGTIRLTIPRSSGARFQLETVRGAVQQTSDHHPRRGRRKGGRVESCDR